MPQMYVEITWYEQELEITTEDIEAALEARYSDIKINNRHIPIWVRLIGLIPDFPPKDKREDKP